MMILFSDDMNFKESNFKALFQYIKKNKISCYFDSHFRQKGKNVAYSDKGNDQINKDFILTFQYQGIYLIDVIEEEIINDCVSNKLWRTFHFQDNTNCWELIIKYFPEKILFFKNLFVYWVDYWEKKIKELNPLIGVNFSGSLVYSKSFSQVMKKYNKIVFCVEHFFTGNDFYFEARYVALPNNSILRNRNYCRLVTDKKNVSLVEVKRKMASMQNKNVKKPVYETIISEQSCLLICQVYNDYAITSPLNPFKNSIGFYKTLIDTLLEKTDKTIIIKTHPYEQHKIKNELMSTYQELLVYINHKSKLESNRIKIYEKKSLEGLIDTSSYVLTLNSQGALEALVRYKPVVCFGNPFYGQKGFTYDFNNINDFINNESDIMLTSEQVVNFWNFMTASFNHLIGNGEEQKIMEKLSLYKDSLIKNKTQFNNKILNTSLKKKHSRNYRIFRKLIYNPQGFFLDSKYKVFNFIGKSLYE